jgi:hypothetical protein
MQTIKNSWTYKHIQFVIILGLVTGIAFESLQVKTVVANALAFDGPIEYVKEPEIPCDLDCLILAKTNERFAANRSHYMEQSRLEALVDVRDMLISRMDESPYVDYEALKNQYGY